MASVSQRIEHDAQDLETYFCFLQDAIHTSSNFSSCPRYFAYAKSDMLANVDSFVEFWLGELIRLSCQKNSEKQFFEEFFTDHKKCKENLLTKSRVYFNDAYQIKMQSVDDSYKALQNLKTIRNCLIHGGSHIDTMKNKDKLSKVIGSTKGVKIVLNTLIEIEDEYILRCLNHAKHYLMFIANDKLLNT